MPARASAPFTSRTPASIGSPPSSGRSADHEALDSFFVVDTFAEHVVDAVGAGDALLAYATLAMLTSGNEAVATILGTIAAGCKCEVDGNVPVTHESVHAKIDAPEVVQVIDPPPEDLHRRVRGRGWGRGDLAQVERFQR